METYIENRVNSGKISFEKILSQARIILEGATTILYGVDSRTIEAPDPKFWVMI